MDMYDVVTGLWALFGITELHFEKIAYKSLILHFQFFWAVAGRSLDNDIELMLNQHKVFCTM